MAFYTGLRLALFAAVWLLLQVVTPLRGLIAIAVAIVLSGIVSFLLLDRPRDQASTGLAGLFRRIDDRIERSRVAEDFDEDGADEKTVTEPSGQADTQGEDQSVGEQQEPGGLKDRDEIAPDGPA